MSDSSEEKMVVVRVGDSIKRVQDVETDEQAIGVIKSLSDGIENEMIMLDHYEGLGQHCPTRRNPMEEPLRYTPAEKLQRIVFVFGLDLV